MTLQCPKKRGCLRRQHLRKEIVAALVDPSMRARFVDIGRELFRARLQTLGDIERLGVGGVGSGVGLLCYGIERILKNHTNCFEPTAFGVSGNENWISGDSYYVTKRQVHCAPIPIVQRAAPA